MEKLRKFERAIEGDYIFHIHTCYTDGDSGIHEYFEKFGDRTLIFTEHVREKPSYDWRTYLFEVRNLGGFAGFEAKILPGGNVDIPVEVLKNCDVLAIAVHSFDKTYSELLDALQAALEKLAKFDLPIVWVHPASVESRIVKNNRIEYIKKVAWKFRERMYIENSFKWRNFTLGEMATLRKMGFRIIEGIDAHVIGDVEKFLSYRSRMREN